MSDDLSGKVACVVDGGQFIEFALRLAREDGFGKVLYFNPRWEPYARVQNGAIGEGEPSLTRIECLWPLPKADCFVFPDCILPGIQEEIRSRRLPVWGSGDGVFLEWRRGRFRETLKEVGLPVHPFTVTKGITELREYLQDKEDQYIRISRWRGNMETMHWINEDLSAADLDALGIELGPMGNVLNFIVEEGYDATEIGYDGYFSGGQFPDVSFHGIECKDKSYFGALVAKPDWPEPIRIVNEAMLPLLKELDYANFFHTEIRVTKDGTPYFTDPTCRQATPAGEPLVEAFSNLPQIVWEGSNGASLAPVVEAEFAAQVLIEHADDGELHWRYLEVPEEVRRWVKLYNPVRVSSELYSFPPLRDSCPTIGSVLGLGHTPEEAIDSLKEHAAALSGQSVTVAIESLASALAETAKADGEAMELGLHEVPEPATALDEST